MYECHEFFVFFPPFLLLGTIVWVAFQTQGREGGREGGVDLTLIILGVSPTVGLIHDKAWGKPYSESKDM
jgi:hypothetical protein